MRGELQTRRRDAGLAVPADDQGERVRAAWDDADATTPDATTPDALAAVVAQRVLSDTTLWDADLARVPGFATAVTASLAAMLRDGVPAALGAFVGDGAPQLA